MPSFNLSSASGSGSAKFIGSVSWSVAETNASGAKISVILYAGLSAGWTWATLDGTIKGDGSTIASDSWGGESSSQLSGTVEVCRGEFWIYFNSSGKASGTISASVKIRNSGSFSSNPTISGSGTATATAPYGASTITLGATTVQMGKKLLISIDADSADCTHTLKYTFGGSTATIATGVKSSYSWTVPDLASKCNNATSGTCTITCTTYLSGSSLGSDTATVTLTVQDPTTPAITGSEVTMGAASTINCKRNSANFSVKLFLEFKDQTFDIATVSSDTASWTPSYDLAKLIPALTSGTGTLKCTTYNGTAEVGAKSVTITVIVPENDTTRPSFTADGLKLTPISSLPEAFAGMYMRGKTGLRAQLSAQSEYSYITGYAVTAGSLSAQGNPAVINPLVNDGMVRVTAKVTDARGFTATVSTTINVLPYTSPKILPYSGYSQVICERAKENGELSANGTYLAIKAGKNFSSVVLNGVEMNSCALRYRWKPNGVDAYSEWITLLADGSAETETELLVGNVVNSLQKSYMVEIEAVDALEGSHKLTFQIMTEAISFVLYDGPDGAGFGKYPEAPHVVDIASHMTLLVRGKMVVEGDGWQDLGLSEGISEDAIGIGRNPVPGCHYRVENGNHVYLAFDGSFDFPTAPLVINRTPIPEAYRPRKPVSAMCMTDVGFAFCFCYPDGFIRVEAVNPLKENTAAVSGMDGYIDYWI